MSRCCSSCATRSPRSCRSRAKPIGPHRNSSTCAPSRRTPTRRDRWRRTSGIHKVRDPRALAAVRELWQTRDHIARRRDIAPGGILPDSAIINAATVDPDTVEKLTALPVFGGNRQRRSAQVWLDALARARTTETTGGRRSRRTGRRLRRAGPGASPRPPPGWRRPAPVWPNCRNGFRCRRRTSSPPRWCAGCAGTGQPVEDTAAAIDEFLHHAGARPWQRELAVPVLTEALSLRS